MRSNQSRAAGIRLRQVSTRAGSGSGGSVRLSASAGFGWQYRQRPVNRLLYSSRSVVRTVVTAERDDHTSGASAAPPAPATRSWRGPKRPSA